MKKITKALTAMGMAVGLLGFGVAAPASAATTTQSYVMTSLDGGARVNYSITWNSNTDEAEVNLALDDIKADSKSPQLSVRFYQNQANQEYIHISNPYGASGGVWVEYLWQSYNPMTLIDIKLCNGEFNNGTCNFLRLNNPYL